MSRPAQPTRERHPQRVSIILVKDALATWIPPTTSLVLLWGAVVLDAHGIVADASAALTAIFALLLLAVFMVAEPLLEGGQPPKIRPGILVRLALAWVTLYAWPFAIRLYPGDAFRLDDVALAGVPNATLDAAGPVRRSPWTRAITVGDRA